MLHEKELMSADGRKVLVSDEAMNLIESWATREGMGRGEAADRLLIKGAKRLMQIVRHSEKKKRERAAKEE